MPYEKDNCTEEKNAVLVAMHHGGTISKGRGATNTVFRIRVRGDSAIIPAGVVHELLSEKCLVEHVY